MPVTVPFYKNTTGNEQAIAVVPVDLSGNYAGSSSGGAAQDAVAATGSPFTFTGTGPSASFTAAGYGAVTVELTGTFVATGQLQTTNDDPSVPDASATWTAIAGIDPGALSAASTGSSISQTAPRRIYPANAGRRYRLNITSYTSGTVTANVVLRSAMPGERAVYVAGFPALPVGGNVIGSVISAQPFTEAFRTQLAAGGVQTGAVRDAGFSVPFSRFGATVVTDQAGTLALQVSTDTANWITVATQAVAANTPADLSMPLRARYNRAVYTNGATATGSTAFSLLTSYTAN